MANGRENNMNTFNIAEALYYIILSEKANRRVK